MSLFRETLSSGIRLFFDGGLGTMLQARGLPAGASPEEFSLERPDVLAGIHREYALAGADILTTNTFGGTVFKLPGKLEPVAFNRRMAAIAREVADRSSGELGRKIFVAGSIGPSGKFLRPLGELSFDDLLAAFREQIRGLVAGGADLLLAETQFDLAEARAAVIAARMECSLPLGVSMTFEDGASLTGSSPEVFAATLGNMGVDFLGTNCSAGPLEMAGVVARLLRHAAVPVMAQPNAGLPELVDGQTVFRLSPEPFAEAAVDFAAQGVQFLGGCCGTTPAHIKALRGLAGSEKCLRTAAAASGRITVTSRSSLLHIGLDQPFRIIGERINPTGKKQLSAELAAGEFTTALRFSDEQVMAGAHILDVNVGAPLVDEAALLPELVGRLAARHSVPLSLDSSNPEAVAAALKAYPASPLVNSISGEAGHLEKLGPLCRDFGAPFVLLPLKGRQLPESAAQRIAVIEELLERMDDLGVPRRLAMVDVLVLTISANAAAARECAAVVRHCTEALALPTVAGLSNVSFGLPARELVNGAFLSMAAGAGLCACIANPGSVRIREAVAAADLLGGKDPAAGRFIEGYSGWTGGAGGTFAAGAIGGAGAFGGKADGCASLSLEDAVILGRIDEIEFLVRAELAAGSDPFGLVGDRLIPAITAVGAKYERREYFLPQLIRSAETMQAAFAVLRPLLEKDTRTGEKTVVVTATVEGDIHDIGKNIVNLMLRNHGFEVVDLGKDVPARKIVDAAKEKKAALIGLSALMTTTMVRMRDTVDLLAEEGLDLPVVVGGAVVTENFARAIGARYAPDAVEAVRLARNLAKRAK